MKLTLNTKTAFAITRLITIIIAFFIFLPGAYSQQMGYTNYGIESLQPFKISSGENVVKIGTIISSYLDLRQYPSGAIPDYTKNTAKLKDARIDIQGKIGSDYEYHLQLDFAAWTSAYAPDGGPLDDANITYKGFRRLFNINVGYGKVPFSLNSLVEHYESPYWERPEISKGDFMSRRDLGIKLYRAFWDDRIRAAAGIYTGTGEVVLGGTNDPSGAPEYIGRVEISYPEAHNEEIVDTKGLTTPNISVGLNGRYSKRDLPAGTSFLPGETGELLNSSDSAMDYKVVNGTKYILGADVSILYRCFSLQLETDNLRGTPQNSNDPLLVGLPSSSTGGYFRAGGWYIQGNYFSKPIKSIFTFRYDGLNADDLVPGIISTNGITNHWAAGISYQIKGYNSMLKAEFDQNLQFDPTTLKYGNQAINTNKWHSEFRLGWQLVID
jgi:hypothetical protein